MLPSGGVLPASLMVNSLRSAAPSSDMTYDHVRPLSFTANAAGSSGFLPPWWSQRSV